jgi:hypothetical protein
LADLSLAAQVKSAIVMPWPEARVEADGGKVVIVVEAPIRSEAKACEEISSLARAVPGVEHVRVKITPTTLYA